MHGAPALLVVAKDIKQEPESVTTQIPVLEVPMVLVPRGRNVELNLVVLMEVGGVGAPGNRVQCHVEVVFRQVQENVAVLEDKGVWEMLKEPRCAMRRSAQVSIVPLVNACNIT